ncbi:hypothetical protein CONCODRAFT_11353 [Conidiobolus coronatus NRRL 28638]|uniref:F-box domain-containing protein n=1 Tax=Conidiobolus coronatus (strain ATCC 28846 / CBS 209.66 / NRRL 28638) TaxID=796925 RepID=A0A137NV97_CONC2|nr:hypothetical protein CONCODRAFT_11353 [Conidiobolus coronatus NRRL 28638]|eukprot:KXN66743.1 hypothetical protein CONCODRAFT_11353 [Conidiobolus coronatus NRRL 28638]
MYLKQLNKDQYASWKHLPDTNTLLEYLGRRDFIELSKCCKRYRNQLERRVLEKLHLGRWRDDNMEIYDELKDSKNSNKILEFLKTDLGRKLKFVNKFDLDIKVDCSFAEIFVKYLPNIKTLIWNDFSEWDNEYEKNLITILNSVEHLKHVELCYGGTNPGNYSTKKQIFPKSLKSLNIYFYEDYYPYYFRDFGYYDYVCTYETLDNSYTNLHSLKIVSNRMLQNLSYGMPNLQEVKIQDVSKLDESKLVSFLKANPQIRKLETKYIKISVEILKTIISLKFLEYWYCHAWGWENIFNSIPSNYSIKHLKINNPIPAPQILQLINSCKGLIILELEHYYKLRELNLAKLDIRVNKLKLPDNYFTSSIIKEFDSSRLFDQIHFYKDAPVEKLADKYNYIIYKLKNYKFIPLISGSWTLKLINKIE